MDSPPDSRDKRESKLWKNKDSSLNKKFHRQPSAGKRMETIMCDTKSMLLIGYLQHKTTTTGQFMQI